MAVATIEVYFRGQWHIAATLTSQESERGYKGSSELEYLVEYAIPHLEEPAYRAAGLSCHYPVDFDLHQDSTWPAFMLDILPSGFGRDHWLSRLALQDNAKADWPLLLNGAAFPPGNLRIREAFTARDPEIQVPNERGEHVVLSDHPGFTLDTVLTRQEHFIEYAVQNGAYTSGASDVQGAAPKFMLVEASNGRWHAEGALADENAGSHWLVKFPRGKKTKVDRQVLKNEAAYMSVARQLGLKVFADLRWTPDTLMIPRFDRQVVPGQALQRYAMESLCSLVRVCDYGVPISQNALCQALAAHATDPLKEVIEFVKRDVANVVLGNKDNHARNTAVFRLETGEVTLTPLFDFAPMYLDPEGIARVCRWDGDSETSGTPHWAKVIEALPSRVDTEPVRAELAAFGSVVERLEDLMRKAGVDDEIIEARHASIRDHSQQLLALK